ncbi:MAG: type III polyketide synthase [Anditalea sp.]
MNNHIVSIGTANPGESIPQENISNFMKLAHGLDQKEGRKLNFIYKRSGINTRHSALEDFKYSNPEKFTFFPKNGNLEPFPSTKQRMLVFQQKAQELAIEAIENCLEKSTTAIKEISHLILVSCTGMYAPGLEMDIIHHLGINETVERYSIHFMGCYASFNALKLADRICDSDPKAKVLIVSVELCTLHFQKEYNENNLLSNAIFGDGAAAVLVSKERAGIQIKGYQSHIYKDGANDMAWYIGDFGFEMKLSKYIPGLLEKGIGHFKKRLEEKFQVSKIKHFAIHPGGIQILKKVEGAFGILPHQNRHAHATLGKFGNMSSATILFILSALLDDKTLEGDVLAMGFGPGLTLETLLLNKI